jgi:HlyD family secretion protein
MTQNVVTYTVEVNTNNDDGKLLPYLTANAKFITGRREDVLFVPNSALRWVPQPDQIVPEARKKRHAADGGRREKGGGAESAGTTQPHGTLWVQQGNLVRPIHVNVGLTDGAFTEVTGKETTEGMVVVTGEISKEDKAGTAAVRSPLMPQTFGRGQQQGQARPDGSDNPGTPREQGGAQR